jgi:hypothetical protein
MDVWLTSAPAEGTPTAALALSVSMANVNEHSGQPESIRASSLVKWLAVGL